jgi:hypothetical protein
MGEGLKRAAAAARATRSYDPLEYIRNTYHVPAFKNRVVKVRGGYGVITGASGPHVAIRLSEEKHSRPYHPSDVDYLVEPDNVPAPTGIE